MPMSAYGHVQPENHDATSSDDDAAPAVRSYRRVHGTCQRVRIAAVALLDFCGTTSHLSEMVWRTIRGR